MTHPDSRLPEPGVKTYVWKTPDILLIVCAADEVTARLRLAEKLREAGMYMPSDLVTTVPTVLAEGNVVWAWR
jgi:hypothetical protein